MLIPVITPKSPLYEAMVLFSVSGPAGGPIRTTGGLVKVYPVPGAEIVTLVTTPAVIDATAVAHKVLPNPTGFCIVTSGVVEYPTPPPDNTMDDIVPAIETLAVAAAPTGAL